MPEHCVPLLSKVEQRQRLPFLVCFGVLAICATVFNLLVLYLFTRYKSLRISLNKFLVSLSVGDLILGTVLAPISMVQLLHEERVPSCTLDKVARLTSTLMAISGVTLGCIAYDRYLIVSSVTKYKRKMTKKMVTFLIVLPWFSPLILVASKFVGDQVNALTVLAMIFLASTVFFFSYLRLVHLLKTKIHPEQGRTQSSVDDMMRQHRREKNRSLVTFLGWVMFWASISSIPLAINCVLQLHAIRSNNTWTFYTEHQPLLTAFARIMFVFNACINPIIYCYAHSGFRKALMKMFRQTSRREERFCLDKNVPNPICRRNNIMEPS